MVAQPVACARPRRLLRAEYDRMAALGFFQGERVELIRGMVMATAPIGPPHSSVVDELNRTLVIALGRRARVRIQQPLLAHDESEPEPDVAVVPEASYVAAHPDRAFLVIEVAESSLAYDRETKAPLYAASRVDEYWIVDVASRTVEVYSQPSQERYGKLETFDVNGVLSLGAFPDVTIGVASLFP